ncbi:hypothetical protein RB195_026532 [Necator americanus]|uniref:Uncharacterized protein n=1 Tax=Necator americanus TaxID=51031 RepID=A0ABR1EWP4_NECAM
MGRLGFISRVLRRQRNGHDNDNEKSRVLKPSREEGLRKSSNEDDGEEPRQLQGIEAADALRGSGKVYHKERKAALFAKDARMRKDIHVCRSTSNRNKEGKGPVFYSELFDRLSSCILII